MKNFIFLSPNFPDSYWQFCSELKKNGIRVLGIGDCPYFELREELRDSLDEYFKVSTLENYDEVYRAVAFFIYKYGPIDFLESNNEYWLERDAQLRTAFNITTGPQSSDMERIKHKSAMKAFYAKAGIPTARYHLAYERDAALAFAHEVGYPIVAKPDNGVGANNTYRITCDEDLHHFFDVKDDNVYIMEEFVNGEVHTYDGIVDANGDPIFESGNVTPHSLMDIVNNNGDSIYYIVKDMPADLLDAGRRTIKAFDVKSRFFHLEFFVLKADQPGLGKKGDIIGLEVNMRPAGGYTPDLYNFAYEIDVYKIWADMIAFNQSTIPMDRPHHFCAFCGRRDGKPFIMDHDAIMNKYGWQMKMYGRIPEALSGAMANQMYVANFDTMEEMQQYYADLLACYE
ncbi:MAG: ATP-grasp domain-containing protein [Oscillospiraceae bacterium]|nr:ATP-grasp domain-containing protein [Oscillospiraceae bacterium]